MLKAKEILAHPSEYIDVASRSRRMCVSDFQQNLTEELFFIPFV